MNAFASGSIHEHQADFERLKTEIAAHPFLKGMAPEHLATLSLYAMRTEFTPGQLVFRQGDMANRFYLIQKGKVLLAASAPGRNPVSIQVVGPGDVLGWSWLFAPYLWRFDSRALELVRAIFFYGTRLREHWEENPRFGHEIMQRVAAVTIERLQQLSQRLLETSKK